MSLNFWRHNNTTDRIDSLEKIFEEIAEFYRGDKEFFEQVFDNDHEMSILSIGEKEIGNFSESEYDQHEDKENSDEYDDLDGTWSLNI